MMRFIVQFQILFCFRSQTKFSSFRQLALRSIDQIQEFSDPSHPVRAPSAENSNLSDLPAPLEALSPSANTSRIAYTTEFIIRKYHYTGHRTCNVRLTRRRHGNRGSRVLSAENHSPKG